MNKTQKKKQCRSILDKYQFKTKITDIEDVKFLNELILNHKYKDEIIGVGISFFYVDSDGRGSRCFHITRNDSSTTHFSYNSCIESFSLEKDINDACRNTISNIIIKYKYDNLNMFSTCDITGEQLTNDNSDVDHYDLTFNELFKNWIKDKDLNVLHESIINADYGMEILGEPHYTDFINFHNNNTHLRLISKTANRSILRKQIKQKTGFLI